MGFGREINSEKMYSPTFF